MKEIYLVAKGKDKDFYKIDKTFDCIDDAEKYIKYMQFYTSENLWIITMNNYFKGEYIQENKGDPLIIAYINSEDKVFKVSISDVTETSKEERFVNLFTFHLARNKKEKLSQFLIRAKEVAIQKQEEYLKNQ